MQEAKKDNKKLYADFKKTDKNKIMYISYKLSNFKEIGSDNENIILLENDLSIIHQLPPYIDLLV
jgi:hypothetical protein